MFTRIIRGLLGMFGIIKKTLKFDTSHNEEFLKSLEPGTIILTHGSGYLRGGIQGATDSAFNHALLYTGKTAGAMARQLFPNLLKNKKIPRESQYHEIVEAQGDGIQVDNLQKNLGDDMQLVAFSRVLTTVELMKVLNRIYSNVGKNYGYLDFVSQLFPDPSAVNLGDDKGFICSALCVDAYAPVEDISLKTVDPQKMTPGQLFELLNKNLNWKKTTYNF